MNQQHCSGFTLLEVLVALLVFGFLAVGLTHGIDFSLRAQDAQVRMLARQADLEPADRVLRQIVTEADPGTFAEGPRFTGGPNGFSLISRLPLAGDGVPTRRAEVAVLVDASQRLVLRWMAAPHLVPAQMPPMQTTTLLGAVNRLEVAYWSPIGTGGAWLRTWTRPDLPALIRIRIVFPDGDLRRWPDIVAAPMRERRAT